MMVAVAFAESSVTATVTAREVVVCPDSTAGLSAQGMAEVVRVLKNTACEAAALDKVVTLHPLGHVASEPVDVVKVALGPPATTVVAAV